ncbi:MAG: hypothetical protein ACLUSP_07915 [Christensenellales bacterium]
MNGDVLLKVEDLCQYFRSGDSTLKAVDGVSFDVRKGEVFDSSARAAAEKPPPADR